jgi:hypothetical protein
MTICDPANYNQDKANTYCDKHYFENANDNKDCKDKSQFCNICCVTEIGNFHSDDREKCMSKCDKSDSGNWIWIPKS